MCDLLMIKLEEEMNCDFEWEWILFEKIFFYFEFLIKFFDSYLNYMVICIVKWKNFKIFLWQGEVDVVGFYGNSSEEGKYVIVDWKVVDILEFWNKNLDVYGRYLYQCLVYVRFF